MELVKPEPLVVAGKAHYTLSSYDFPEIKVLVPRITKEDVTYAYLALVMQAGGQPEDSTSDIWVQKTFGVPGVDALTQAVHQELEAQNQMMVEQQKADGCANELASRLQQRVYQGRVNEIRSQLMESLTADLAREGVSQADFLRSVGMSMPDLERTMEQQAKTAAEHEAAILAWAAERDVTVNDSEIPELLGIPEDEDANKILDQARHAGDYEDMRQAALQNKAMNIIMSECSCTYVHETAEEAATRAARMQAQMQAELDKEAAAGDDADDSSEDGPRFTLV